MIIENNQATSPVVGVMLMLVVTIIIAAVVSAFAGGLTGSQDKTPQATVSANAVINGIDDIDTYNYVPDYPSDEYTTINGIEFENKGGDTFSISDIDIEIASSYGTVFTIAPADEINRSSSYTCCLPSGITSGGYVWKIGNTSLSDTTIAPGDKFMFYADNCYINGSVSYLTWKPVGSVGMGYVNVGENLKYTIVDRDSSRTITSGELFFK